MKLIFNAILALALMPGFSAPAAEVCNLKVVTDASPDYSDMPSMLHSITANWPRRMVI